MTEHNIDNSSRSEFQVIDTNIHSHVQQIISNKEAKVVKIASPFIKDSGVQDIIRGLKKRSKKRPLEELRIITKFDLKSFVYESSSLEALDTLFKLSSHYPVNSVTLYNLPVLHAKIFLNENQGIIGSANLTMSGLHDGNAEVCVLFKAHGSVQQLQKAYLRLEEQSIAVTETFMNRQKKLLERIAYLKKQHKALNHKIEEIQLASRLCRLPPQNTQAEKGNYYAELHNCLNWIFQGRQHCRSRKSFRHKLTSNVNGTHKERVADLRTEFLREVGLVKPVAGDRITLTSSGLDIIHDSSLLRQRMFQRLVQWCEISCHDRSLNELLRPFANQPGESWKITHDNWSNGMHDMLRKLGTTHDNFQNDTEIPRNWLVSLGVLRRRTGSGGFYYYDKGENFPTS